MNTETMNVLFYSDKCPFCIQCLEMLEPFADKVRFLGYINVHKARGMLPANVERVPTLILNNGDTFYEGRQVYQWIIGLIKMIESEQRQETNNVSSVNVPSSKNDTVKLTGWVESQSDNNSYVSIDHKQTITESIDYSKIKSIEKEQEKISVSPDALQEQRNSNLQRFLPNTNQR